MEMTTRADLRKFLEGGDDNDSIQISLIDPTFNISIVAIAKEAEVTNTSDAKTVTPDTE